MKITYTAPSYDPTKSYRRYVRNDHGDGYRWCETEGMYDVRQGSVEASELPDDVRAAADARCGWSPPYVEWPRCPKCLRDQSCAKGCLPGTNQLCPHQIEAEAEKIRRRGGGPRFGRGFV